MVPSLPTLVLALAAASTAATSGMLPGPLRAPAAPDAPATGAQDAPALVLESLDGEVTRRGADAGAIQSLAAAGAAFVRFEGLPAAPAGAAEIPLEDRASLELAGGDRITAAVRGGAGDTLELELVGGARLSLTVDAIRSVVFPARIPDAVTESPSAGPDGDRLYLVAGDALDRAVGFVDAFGAEAVTFEDARLGARDFPWDRVAALFITPLEDEFGGGEFGGEGEEEGDSGERVSVSIAGGGRLSGELVEITGPVEGVVLTIGGQSQVRLPGSVCREVALDDGSFAFLSDLVPAEDGASSLFGDEVGFRWPPRVDRDCKGGPLVVGGQLFDRGLGVHAPSRMVWQLEPGRWTELRLACGVDDSGQSPSDSSVRGTVVFRVLGDGEVLWESGIHRAGAAAFRPEPLDVSGVTELALEADPAGDFVLDRANWLRPLLVAD